MSAHIAIDFYITFLSRMNMYPHQFLNAKALECGCLVAGSIFIFCWIRNAFPVRKKKKATLSSC